MRNNILALSAVSAEIQHCLVNAGDVGCGVFECFENNSCEIRGLQEICLTFLHNAGKFDSQVTKYLLILECYSAVSQRSHPPMAGGLSLGSGFMSCRWIWSRKLKRSPKTPLALRHRGALNFVLKHKWALNSHCRNCTGSCYPSRCMGPSAWEDVLCVLQCWQGRQNCILYRRSAVHLSNREKIYTCVFAGQVFHQRCTEMHGPRLEAQIQLHQSKVPGNKGHGVPAPAWMLHKAQLVCGG